MQTDDALIAGVIRDLDGTFPALVGAHQDRLFSVALRMLGNAADAEEVAQDALVRAYRALGSYEEDRLRELRLRPWLSSIVVNVARNRRRRIWDRQPPVSIADVAEREVEPVDTGRSPLETALEREREDMLGHALLELPRALREAVVLRHVADLSTAETAAALGRPEGTIKAQVHRGLAHLRRILEVDGPAGRNRSPTAHASTAPDEGAAAGRALRRLTPSTVTSEVTP